jgi:asparagine synthase (glutamine-hydrolysing)
MNVRDGLPPPERELILRMIGALRHRGPDEHGLYRDERVGLGHARLSIIDLSTGQQPLTNEDGRYWIVFNGEIFNYVELRKDLEAAGHRFRTQSDTEVIVHAYEEWGNECFPRFNGQWAIGLWDARERELILARDRIGVRPLYVHAGGGRIRFASEVKSIFADPSVVRAIDPRGLDQTFTYWTSLAPITVFEGVEEIPPGSLRVYDSRGTVREAVYWYPRFSGLSQSGPMSIGAATAELHEKLTRATAMRILLSDVPVGSYLSGGLDSSLTAWLGRQVKTGEFHTFSLRFEDAEFDESPYQRLMASRLDSIHHEVTVSRSDIAAVLPNVIWHTERPVLRTAPAPMYLLSRLVRENNIKAVLTGEGADEMFAGYDLFREAAVREFWSRDPSSRSRPRLFDRLYPYLARSPQRARGMALEFWRQGLERVGQPGFSHEPRWRTTAMLKKFYSTQLRQQLLERPAPGPLERLPAEFSGWDSLERAQYLEIVTLLSGYLISSQGDRMLMAHSVEGRFPFLDADVMEFANRLPPEMKLRGLREKRILKRLGREILPEAILDRPKQPYRSPDAVSLLNPLAAPYVDDLLSADVIRSGGAFEAASVASMHEKCRARFAADDGVAFSNTDNMSMVGIVSYQLLHQQFIATAPRRAGEGLRLAVDVERVRSESHVESET